MLCDNCWRSVELPSVFNFPIVEDADPAIQLLCAVLKQAVSDLYLPANNPNNSICWFLSSSFDTMSFLWLCFHLELNAERVIMKHAPRIRELLNEL